MQYLEWRRDTADLPMIQKAITAALDGFWRERARSAPTASDLIAYENDQRRFLDATRGSQQME